MLVKYVSVDGIPQAFLFFRFVDIIAITVHDRFWNVGQANWHDRADVTVGYMCLSNKI
jgi:hypothetical protein